MNQSLHIESVSPARFAETVEAALAPRESLHTHLLSAARALDARPTPPDVRLWLAMRGGSFAGAALLGPSGDLEFVGDPRDIDAWARALGTVAPRWVGGERATTTALLDRIGGRWAQPMTVEVMATSVAQLAVTGETDGCFGLAEDRDRICLTGWVGSFLEEVALEPVDGLSCAVSSMIARGDAFVWRVDGAPVSMVAIVARTRTVVRFSLVYTPPTQRRRHYAQACTGETTRRLLAEGWQTCSVHVRAEDVPAKLLYSGLGYHRVGVRIEVSRS